MRIGDVVRVIGALLFFSLAFTVRQYVPSAVIDLLICLIGVPVFLVGFCYFFRNTRAPAYVLAGAAFSVASHYLLGLQESYPVVSMALFVICLIIAVVCFIGATLIAFKERR